MTDQLDSEMAELVPTVMEHLCVRRGKKTTTPRQGSEF